MSTARKGADFERRCRQDLEDAGWQVVRSAASKGPADLWATRVEQGRLRLLMVQVKANSRPIGVREWNTFCQHCELSLAEPIIADKLPGRPAPIWWKITGLKTPGGGPQPRVPFDIHGWAEAAA